MRQSFKEAQDAAIDNGLSGLELALQTVQRSRDSHTIPTPDEVNLRLDEAKSLVTEANAALRATASRTAFLELCDELLERHNEITTSCVLVSIYLKDARRYMEEHGPTSTPT